jgi:hypothetical protein
VVRDLLLLVLILVVAGLVIWWIDEDATDYHEHDPEDWP